MAVNVIGPKSDTAETHADVSSTLARAGKQLSVSMNRVAVSDRAVEDPGEPYALALENLAEKEPKRRDTDIVLLYRGGIDTRKRPLKADSCRRILNAADELVSLGIEVVIGIGHGETSIHGIAGREPSVGTFEVVTPTAGAN